MRILFVSSGNSGKISPIVLAQGESLRQFGLEVVYFTIQGKGIQGYTKNIFKLRKFLKNNSFDCIHAHFVLSALVATMAGAKPLVVSLMGSDTAKGALHIRLTRFLQARVWDYTLVKSEKMKDDLGVPDILVLPNGVNFKHFRPINQQESLETVGWNPEKRYVLFASSPSRPEKNYALALEAFSKLNMPHLVMKTLDQVSFDQVPFYYCAADVVLLTSHREGSPNVIKEAMACNRPIVVTDVGDVKKVLGQTAHCYVVDSKVEHVSAAVKKIVDLPYISTNGRENIQWLNQEVVAQKLVEIYKELRR